MYEKCFQQSAFVVEVRAAEECGGDVRSRFFFFFFFFFFTVGLCGGEIVHLNINFVQFFQFIQRSLNFTP